MTQRSDTYRQKLLSPEELVGRMQPGNFIVLGCWSGQPHGVMRAIDRYGSDTRPLYVSVNLAFGDAEFLQRPGVYGITGFFGPYERAARDKQDSVSYSPVQFADAWKWLRDADPPDFFIHRVSPPDGMGNCNVSLAPGWEYGAIRWLHENSPRTQIVFEVNPNLPPACGVPEHGNNEIPLSYADWIVEDDAPLIEVPSPEPTDVDRAIAEHVVGLIDDRATLQLGFGTIPMAIGRLLTARKGLGIHSEMFCESHLDLIDAGSVSNTHKGLYDGKSVATFAAGTARLHAWARKNPELALLPVEQINSVPVLSRVRNLFSVNGALAVDLAGQTCAHCIGPRTYSGLGGAFEFTYGAQLSPGGKSVVCLPSTSTLKDGRVISTIQTHFPAGTRVTIPEHCIDWVVTEHGAVRLKLMTLEQRADALIRVAHPDFREQLARDARDAGFKLSQMKDLPPTPAQFFHRGAGV